MANPIPANTTYFFLNSDNEVVLKVGTFTAGTNVYVRLDGQPAPSSSAGAADNSISLVLNDADGSVRSYTSNRADGTQLQLSFAAPTANTVQHFGPGNIYSHGALELSRSSYPVTGTAQDGMTVPLGTIQENKVFENGRLVSYETLGYGANAFRLTGTIDRDDGSLALEMVTKLHNAPIQATGPAGSSMNSLASLSAAQLVATNGAIILSPANQLIGQDGGSIVAAGGGNIVAAGGGNLIGQDGASLIGQDGGSIVAAGGGNIVAAGGGNLVGQDGGSFAPRAFAASSSSPDPDVQSAMKVALNFMSAGRGYSEYSGTSFVSYTGDGGDNSITGGVNDDTIRGGLGIDVLTGGGGDDTIYGGDSNLVRNGGFETVDAPVFDANGYSLLGKPLDGWTLLSGPAIELHRTDAAAGSSVGLYEVDLEGNQANTNVAISQVLTQAEDDRGYWLAFDVRKTSATAQATLEVYWGGQKLVLTQQGATAINATTSTFTYAVHLTGGAGTGSDRNRLTFKETGGGDANGTQLDNVRVYRDTDGNWLTNDPARDGGDLIDGGTGSDTVFGHGGDDLLTFSDVGNGTDNVDGGSGTDLLVMDWSLATTDITYRGLSSGATANISYRIGQAESYNRAAAGNGDNGQTLWFKEVERFILSGGSGNDTLKGGALADILSGGGGNDTLIGGGGGDTFNGGAGFDRAVIQLSGSGNNTIVLKNLQNGGTTTLSDGTKLTSIEAVDLVAGNGDDVLDVRGTVANPSNLLANNPSFPTTSTRFEGFGGDDTLAVDLATSVSAFFDGGAGTGDLLVMDWSAATTGISRYNESYGSSYQAFWKTVRVNNVDTNYYYKVGISGVERFDLTGGSGNDVLYGGDKDDRIKTIGGRDTAYLGAGFDTLVVDYTAQAGNFTFDPFRKAAFAGSLATGYSGSIAFGDADYGSSGIDFSGVERFELYFGAGNDRLRGGDGNDILSGGAGSDYLTSFKGTDILCKVKK